MIARWQQALSHKLFKCICVVSHFGKVVKYDQQPLQIPLDNPLFSGSAFFFCVRMNKILVPLIAICGISYGFRYEMSVFFLLIIPPFFWVSRVSYSPFSIHYSKQDMKTHLDQWMDFNYSFFSIDGYTGIRYRDDFSGEVANE